MKLLWLIVVCVAVVSAAQIRKPGRDGDGKVRYDDHKVFKLHISNKTQLSAIERIQDISGKYNLWKDYDEVSKEVHIMVRPEELGNFNRLMTSYGIQTEIMIPNVQLLMDEEQAGEGDTDSNTFGWTRYYDLHEIETWFDGILDAFPNVTEPFTIGKSFEGRYIRGMKISFKAGNPGIFIESNVHAREWITSATATWFINELLTSENPEVRKMAEENDWYIVPVYNVDGFVYSHEKDRMWRKSRQPAPNSNCIGADINRNFDSHWLENGGSDNNPCGETFAGTAAFSETEAKSLANYLTGIKDKLNIYISFHSYGQYLLSPYGHTRDEFPANYNDLLTIGSAFSNAIGSLPYKTEYTYGSTSTILYIASGTSVDWVFNTLAVKVAYTIEYRDKSRYGFVLPPAQILPNCEEAMAGILALVSKSKELGY